MPVLQETYHRASQLDPQHSVTIDVLGDHDTLKQVLLIALDNAIKHSSGDIVVSAAKRETQIEIRVQDFGEGSVAIPGFGLGLAIGQGDSIQMESELGKGSVVILTFYT